MNDHVNKHFVGTGFIYSLRQHATKNGMKFVHIPTNNFNDADFRGIPYPGETGVGWHAPFWLNTDGSPTMYVFSNIKTALLPVVEEVNKIMATRTVSGRDLNEDDVVILVSD